MKKLLTITTAIAGLAVLAAVPAMATPLTGPFTVTVYQGTNAHPGNSGDLTQQALPSAITAIQARPGSFTSPQFTYTGPLNLTGGSNPLKLNTFFASAGGSTSIVLPGDTLSHGNFADETLIKFTFTTNGPISGIITHDDGISLYQGTTQILNSSNPTSAIPTTFTNLSGTYDLYYSEVNGAPGVINFDVTRGNSNVPEPVSMALLGTALVSLGLIRRRSQRV